MSTFLAKKGIFSFNPMEKVWLTFDHHYVLGKYVVIHFMNNSTAFGRRYKGCFRLVELNEIKSQLLNNGFKIDWNEFNKAVEYLK